MVITRSREASKTDIWKMSDQTAGQWFIVETNSDHGNTPGERRVLATKCLKEMTQKVTFIVSALVCYRKALLIHYQTTKL